MLHVQMYEPFKQRVATSHILLYHLYTKILTDKGPFIFYYYFCGYNFKLDI